MITSFKLAVPTILVAVAVVAPASLAAQLQFTSQAAEITLTGRVHFQFRTSSVDGEQGSEFLIRRARMTAHVTINDLVDGRIQPDFGLGRITLKDAYLRLSFDPAFRVSFGQFKRAFDIFQLYSSTQILTIDGAGLIRGVDSCLITVCSWSALSLGLQHSERDVGVLMDGRPSGKVEYRVSITNGTGANRQDENGTKSYAGRMVVQATSNVRIGGNFSVHDYLDQSTANQYAVAYGGDVEIGRYGDEVHIQAGLMGGENWRDLDASGDPSTFVAAQAVVSYRFPVTGSERFTAVEPLARVSWADPNTGAVQAGGWLFTPGVALHIIGRNMLVANVDIWSPAIGGTEWSFKFQSFLHY